MVATFENDGVKAARPERSLEATASRRYFRLLAERYSLRLLSPFACSACGLIALDPIAWAAPRRPLSENCADPEATP